MPGRLGCVRGRNRLIDTLPAPLASLVHARGEIVNLALGPLTAKPGSVFFPMDGLIATRRRDPAFGRVEMRLVGVDGMVGPRETAAAASGEGAVEVLFCGPALMVSRGSYLALLANPVIRAHFESYRRPFEAQRLLPASAPLSVRLAQILCMVDDRLRGRTAPLGFAILAGMLEVPIEAVVEGCETLQTLGFLRTDPRGVADLERGGLEQIAGDWYGGAEQLYRETFPN